ncbi:ABC transporter substrate-binding protein [Roseibium sp.]|uniref:ABC transporter substrate-binding protein n=1 Tax=Roseibium sp. TaxID=1936156 RepID=UPI003A97D74F
MLKRSMSRRLFTAAMITSAVLFGAAVPQAVKAEANNTLTYAAYGDIKDWDPSIAFSLEVIMLANVYEPLVWFNPPGSDKPLRPGLAESWEASDDGLTWTFHLRQGVKFHDGSDFDAEAAKASIERTMNMKQGAYYIWSPVSKIEAADKYTLKITTKDPAPIDRIASSQYGAYMISPKAIAMGEEGTVWFNEGHDAGTGPYKVRQWEKDQHVVLEKADNYWGGWKAGDFDRVILKVVKESATQIQMLKSGEADYVSLVPADAMNALSKDPKISVGLADSWKNSQFLINVKKAPTDNLKFRQALTHLWDYRSVVDGVYAGSASVATGPLPSTMWGHNPSIETPKFDIELAKKLIEESGVPEADRKVTIAYIGTSEEYKNAALLFQANAAKAGVDVELLPGPWGTIWDRAKNLETAPNLQSMTWWPTYPTPSDWLIGLFRSEDKALFNLSHYSNPDFDKTVDEAAALEGYAPEKALQKYYKAQEILMNDAPAIFYADIRTRIASSANIRGFVANPAYNAVFFKQLSRAAD